MSVENVVESVVDDRVEESIPDLSLDFKMVVDLDDSGGRFW